MLDQAYQQKLVDATVELLIKNKGTLSYKSKYDIRSGTGIAKEMSAFDKAVFCLADASICYLIPIYDSATRQSYNRDYDICWRGAETFGITNTDENRLIALSKDTENGLTAHQKIGKGTFTIGELSFRDTSHDVYHAGWGRGECDFKDSFGQLFEAKYKCKKGSPSSFHDAQYVLDYDDRDVRVYEIIDGMIPQNAKPIATYENVMTVRVHLDFVPGVDLKLMQLITSGKLIPKVMEKLKEKGIITES
jgi:hypothetical protein